MTKHLKRLAILLLTVIMSGFVLACQPNKGAQKSDEQGNDNNAIYFENQVTNDRIVYNEFKGNAIIRSNSELEKFFTDHCVSEEHQAVFDKFNLDYFSDKGLVLCYFWASDGRIERRLENVYVDGNTLRIEVINILPYPLNDMLTDCYFFFNILQVKKSDILNVTDITVSFKDVLKD